MLGQLQLADDLRIKQRDRVGRHRIAESRMKFLGDRRAADHRTSLEQRDLESGRGQVRGADQAVMAAADDQGIAMLCSQGRRLLRAGRGSEQSFSLVDRSYGSAAGAARELTSAIVRSARSWP